MSTKLTNYWIDQLKALKQRPFGFEIKNGSCLQCSVKSIFTQCFKGHNIADSEFYCTCQEINVIGWEHYTIDIDGKKIPLVSDDMQIETQIYKLSRSIDFSIPKSKSAFDRQVRNAVKESWFGVLTNKARLFEGDGINITLNVNDNYLFHKFHIIKPLNKFAITLCAHPSIRKYGAQLSIRFDPRKYSLDLIFVHCHILLANPEVNRRARGMEVAHSISWYNADEKKERILALLNALLKCKNDLTYNDCLSFVQSVYTAKCKTGKEISKKRSKRKFNIAHIEKSKRVKLSAKCIKNKFESLDLLANMALI